MAGNIMVGFEGLSPKQAATLLQYAKDNELFAKQGKNVAAPAGTGQRGRPKKVDPETGKPVRTAREVTAAAKVYRDTYGDDAQKTVLNHFGATSISGKEGVPEDKMAEVYDAFTQGKEFVPSATIADEFPDDDGSGEEDSGKKKKDKKGKKGKKKKKD